MKRKAFSFNFFGDESGFYCYIKIIGKLTHDDYEEFIPIFEQAISNIEEVNVKILVDIKELESWDLEAFWDDLKFGIEHDKDFSHIAVLGNSKFQEFGLKFASLFTNAIMKYFYNENDAREWLNI